MESRAVENNSYQTGEPDQNQSDNSESDTQEPSQAAAQNSTYQSEDDSSVNLESEADMASLKELELQQQADLETDEHFSRVFNSTRSSQKPARAPGLADELGIEDIYQPLVGGHGKLFCAAGRDAPLVVFEDDCLVLHPAQKPLIDDSAPVEEMVVQVNDRGLLLNELGEVKKITAAKYRGRPIFISGEQRDNTYKHYVVAEDWDGSLHFIFDEDKEGERITSDEAYRLRNSTHNGELAKFSQLSSTLDEGDDSFIPESDESNPDDVSQAEVN